MVLLKIWLSLQVLFATPKPPTVKFKTEMVKLGGVQLKVAIADTTEKRTQGLMFVENWSKYDGMFFLFPKARTRVFWMRNTFLPLSLGFFDDKKRLFEVQKLNPAKSLAQKNVDRVRSKKPARYVLEVPQGWFKKNKIEIGSTIEGVKATSL